MHTLSRKLLRRARGTHIAESGLSPTSTVPKHGALQRVNFKTQNPRIRLLCVRMEYTAHTLHGTCALPPADVRVQRDVIFDFAPDRVSQQLRLVCDGFV